MFVDHFIHSSFKKTESIRGAAREGLKTAKGRLIVASGSFAILILCVFGRLIDISVLQRADESLVVESNFGYGLQMSRGEIIDRNGELLATNIVTGSLFANATDIQNPEKIVEKLVKIIPDASKSELVKRLSSQKTFIWLARHLTPAQQKKVMHLGIPGLHFKRDEKRIYPHGEVTAHLLGFTDVDNKGISGIENTQDQALRSGQTSVQLTIDIRLQSLLHEELKNAMEEFKAIAANAIIIKLDTAEVVGMVSLPDFNPNQGLTELNESTFDRNITGTYEMGSTMKIINTAMALDRGNIPLSKKYDATKPILIGRFKVHDFKGKNTWLSVDEIFKYSSNIGSSLMALEVGIAGQKNFMDEMGLLRPASVELSGSAYPIYPKHWREANLLTIAYGYGISVSPVGMAEAVLKIITGRNRKLTLIHSKVDESEDAPAVVKETTSKQIHALMRLAILDGTCGKANVPGFIVTGKTGTAMKRVGGRYKDGKVSTSFIGTIGADMAEPEYMVLVMLDEPKASSKTYGYTTAGWNAAPTAGKILKRMTKILGLKPHKTLENTNNGLSMDSVQAAPPTDIQSLIRLASYRE